MSSDIKSKAASKSPGRLPAGAVSTYPGELRELRPIPSQRCVVEILPRRHGASNMSDCFFDLVRRHSGESWISLDC